MARARDAHRGAGRAALSAVTPSLPAVVAGREPADRQTQTWVGFPGLGWKVVAAHVSTMNDAPLW